MENLAIIPARSGSKGIKDKNIKELNGKPLLAYTIEAAINSKMFDTVHVSTDSEFYAKIAKQYLAEVPFLRDVSYAQDSSSTWDVVKFVLSEYKKINKQFDTVTVLQPTSPLRNAQNIKECFEQYRKKNADAVVSLCEVEHSPLLCGKISENGLIKNFISENIWNKPRQVLPQYYRINGAIYLLKPEVLYKYNSIYECEMYSYIMDSKNSIDIDSELDFMLAEQIVKYYMKIDNE